MASGYAYPDEVKAVAKIREFTRYVPAKTLARVISGGTDLFESPSFEVRADQLGSLIGRKLSTRRRCFLSVAHASFYTTYSRIRRYDAKHPITFKVGDTVKIVRNGRQYEGSPGFDNSWVMGMDPFIGETFVVERVASYGVRFENEGAGDCAYPPQVLKKVKSK